MVYIKLGRLELDFEKVGEIGRWGIAKNGNVSCGIICKLLMQKTVGRLIVLNEEEPGIIQIHSAKEANYLKVKDETFKT